MTTIFHNKTRTARSIPKKLIKEKKPYLIPVYYAMLTSRLAREGIANSGSYHFADHIYAGNPSGSLIVGHLLDRLLLSLPSAKSFRNRYLYSKVEVRKFINNRPLNARPIKILAAPSGLARELFELARELDWQNHPTAGDITWHGLDLDKQLIDRLRQRTKNSPGRMFFYTGDALQESDYLRSYDIIISLGLGEFLEDAQLIQFYKISRNKLLPGGQLITSCMRPHPLSDYLMKNLAELHTHYRSRHQLTELARAAGFSQVQTYDDAYGLQTMLIATKEGV